MGQITISWSSLSAHRECKQRSHLLRQGKRSNVFDIRQFFHGTVVDRASREYLDEEANQYPGFMAESIVRIMDREEQAAIDTGDGIVKWRSSTDRADVLALCIEAADKLEPLLNSLILPRKYQTAFRFKVPLRIPYLDGTQTTIRLIGEMDYLTWFQDSSHYEIHDLKVTRDDQYWRKTIAQLVFYDIAVFADKGHFTKRVGLIQPLCKKKTIDFEVTNQQRVEMMQSIINMAHDIWKKDHSLRPDTTKCGFCIVKHSCERYKMKDGRISFGPTVNELLEDM